MPHEMKQSLFCASARSVFSMATAKTKLNAVRIDVARFMWNLPCSVRANIWDNDKPASPN
jgi:hypothetical protein